MADITYVEGSREYIAFTVEVDDPEFVVEEWSAEAAFTPRSAAFDAETATWHTAQLVPGADACHFEARVMQGPDAACDLSEGRYMAHVRLTHAEEGPGRERPLLRASGTVTVAVK